MAVGQAVPPLSGLDIQGEQVSLSRFRGKALVLFFWKSSCCGDKLKLLEPYYGHNSDKGVALLAINAGDSRSTVETFARDGGLTFPMQCDEYAMTARQYGVFGFPTLFIIDSQGKLQKKILGDISVAQLEKLVAPYVVQ